MSQGDTADRAAESERLLREHRRRESDVAPDLYAPWQAPEDFMRAERRRQAIRMLHRAGVFPSAQTPCLEVGYGRLGWLGDLISWGVWETCLAGIELDPARGAEAGRVLPAADLRIGDASEMPWADASFQLVIASTVFTSVLDTGMRDLLGREIERVLRPGGALLWYDFRVNPRNRHTKAIGRRELRSLFPGLTGDIRSVTLAPPLTRRIASWSHLLVSLLERIPALRTHLIAVLVKSRAA